MTTPQSIAHLFLEACTTYDKKDAVLVKEDGSYRPYSHRFFRQRVQQFARGLIGLGLAPGDKVGLMAETRFEWAVADLGIICAGGVDVPVYPTQTAEQAAFILANAEVTGLVVSNQAQLDKILETRDQLPPLRFIICMDAPEQEAADVRTMADVEAMGNRLDNEYEMEARTAALGPDTLLTIIYTSGTTGNPKGVMLSHGNLVANCKSCESYMPYGKDDIHLSHLPLSHVLERMSGYYSMLMRGVTIAYAEDIRKVAENIREVRPTVLVSVPRVYEKMYAGVMQAGRQSGFFKRKLFQMAMGVGKQAVPFFNTGKTMGGLLGYKWNMADKLVYSKVKEATGGRLKYMVSGGAPLPR